MAIQLVTLTVMGGAAAPFNANGPAGNEFSSTLSGSAIGISEAMDFEVQNIIQVRSYFQPSSGPQYTGVNSVVRYKGVNPNNGYALNIKLYVNETRAAIKALTNA